MTPRLRAQQSIVTCFLYDVFAGGLAMLFAVEIRYWLDQPAALERPHDIGFSLVIAAIFTMSAAVSFYILRIYRQIWRYTAPSDIAQLVQATGLAFLLFLPGLFLGNRLEGLPRSSLLIAFPVWFLMLTTARMFVRGWLAPHMFGKSVQPTSAAPAALLVGEQEDIAELFRSMREKRTESPVRAIGLVTMKGEDTGRSIGGVPVLGALAHLTEHIETVRVRRGEEPHIAVVGSQPRAVLASCIRVASEHNLTVIRLCADDTLVSPIAPEHLLSRPARVLDRAPVCDLIKGRNVLVTGAGGSIGSELVKQCLMHEPNRLALLDSSEYNLYRIDSWVKEQNTSTAVSSVFGDVRNRERLDAAMAFHKPDIVLHAAALKHVPLMETNPCEAVLTNVLGVQNTCESAVAHGVSSFVLISTDKAIEPTTVMGATKRIAEHIVTSTALKHPKTKFSTVRFGNALGSSGSVMPLFERQIAQGGPVTVTHPDVTRFFMTMEEAAGLVLQAAAKSIEAGEVQTYVLDMGEPVRIQDLAETMIRLKGKVPGRDIEIHHTGLRPGEKLHEILASRNETLAGTDVEGVLTVERLRHQVLPTDQALTDLLTLASNYEDLRLRDALMTMAMRQTGDDSESDRKTA